MFGLKLEMFCAHSNANPTDSSKMKVKARSSSFGKITFASKVPFHLKTKHALH